MIPLEKYVFLQYGYTFLATSSLLISGIAVGWSSAAVPQLLNGEANVILTIDETSWVTSLFSLGQIGAILYVRFGDDWVGRKISILITFVLAAIGWVFLVAGRQAWHLYVGRISFGLSACVCWGTLPLYIGEISSKNVRGSLCTLPLLMLNLGSLVSYAIGPFTTYNNAIYIYLTMTVGSFLLCLFILPESPYILVKKKRRNEAEKVLLKLKGTQDVKLVQNDLEHIENVVSTDMERQTSYKELFCNSACRKSVLIVTALKIFQQTSGMQAISSYVQTIFDNTSISLSGSLASIIYGVTKLCAGFAAAFMMDSFGRRKLTLVSFVGISVALTSIGAYFFVQDYIAAPIEVMDKINWIPLTAMLLFSFTFAIGLGPIAGVLGGELFATNIKGPAMSVGVLFLTISQLITVKTFQTASDAFGNYAPFFCFGFLMICGTVFTLIFVPETKGKTFDEIQLMLKNRTVFLKSDKNETVSTKL